MMDTKQTLIAFRLTKGKPRRRVTEAEFRLACARLRWPEQAVTVLLERSGPGVWWEVGHELLGVHTDVHGPALPAA